MIRLVMALLLGTTGPADLARRYRLVLVLYTLTGVAQGAVFLAVVPLVQAVVDDRGALVGAALTVALLAVVALVLDYAVQGLAFRLGCDIGRHLHRRLGDHVVGLPLGWFGGDQVGRLGRLVSSGVLDVMNSVAHTQRRLVSAVVSPLTILVGSLLIEWRLTVLLVVLVPVVAGVYVLTQRAGSRVDEVNEAAAVEAADRVVEYARTQPVQRAYGRTTERFAALDAAFSQQRTGLRRVMGIAVPAVVGFGLSTQLVFLLAVLGGTLLVVRGSLDVGTLLGVLVLVLKFVEPLQLAGAVLVALRVERGSAERIRDVLATSPLPEPTAPTPTPTAVVPAAVELRDVDFAYPSSPDQQVLRRVSFTVPARSTVAVVGPSGSGKTTIARLVSRFFDVDAGAVLVNGVDVREQRSETLVGSIAPVFQDVFLFSGSIEDNIRLARPGADADEFAAAVGAARVDEIVRRLPHGWQTQVGEGGSALSGGERARVALARALLKDAQVVVLDEPTASIDSENEAAVTAALAELARTRTVLVIAHRLQTIREADQILVLEQGAITARGRHDELLHSSETYARFWRSRVQATSWVLAGEA